MEAAMLPDHARVLEKAPARSLADLEPVALEATRAAAIACQRWVGRGRPHDADAAATEAMRSVLAQAPARGVVIVGEGAKDEAPMLFDGERLGNDDGFEFDIAVDPLECTTLCSKGLPSSLATIAFAQRGTMASISAAFYMDKLVGPHAVRGLLDISDPPEVNLERTAQALGKPVSELRVVVLDKPRHESLIERLHRTGAEVSAPPDGDVAGALATLLPGGEADLLMGIGGTPEGVMTACAAHALGGFMQARLAPQRPNEVQAVAQAGLSTEKVYELDELAAGESLFVASGVTGGSLLRRPWREGELLYTESIVIAAGLVRRMTEARLESPAIPERATRQERER